MMALFPYWCPGCFTVRPSINVISLSQFHMGIVVITMVGVSKLAFASALAQKTHGAVDLVIVQRSSVLTLRERFLRAQKMFRERRFFSEMWYSLMLRLHPKARRTLAYFRESSAERNFNPKNTPKILEVDSVNSEETLAVLRKLSPDLLVVWGSKRLDTAVLATAKQSINLHIGRCPYYRGTLANQHAVLSDDFTRIGATVHHVASEIDSGDILSIIEPDLSKKPRELFCDLNDRAQATCIDIAARLYAGEQIPKMEQDRKTGKTLFLREWTPAVRYKVATRMREWEENGLTLA